MDKPTSINEHNLREAAGACVLFSKLPAAQQEELLEHSRIIYLREGEYLFQQGDQATEFFLLLGGELKLAAGSPSGQEKILHIVSPRQTFGEALMFLQAPAYPVNAMALTASQVAAFPNKQYKNMLRGSVEACFGVMGSYSLRIRHLVDEIEVLTLHNATFRVIHYLLKEIPGHQQKPVSVKLSAPKNAIASRLAITPETLSRILAKLKRDKIIDVSDKKIHLLNIGWMREFIASS